MIGMILIVIALAQFIFFGFNIFTFFFLILLAFIAGLLAGPRRGTSQRDSDNLATIVQIERNRYYSPYKNKE